MKRTVLIGLLVLVLALALGCTPTTPTPSPSPITPATPLASPSPAAVVSPNAGASPAVTNGGATGGTETITGFEEGKTVEESELPQKVKDAIKEAYSNVKIKTITYVTYMNDQVYHVVLEEPAGTEKVDQFYIKADGTIVPYAPTASASPKAAS